MMTSKVGRIACGAISWLALMVLPARGQWSTNWTSWVAITNWPSSSYTYHVWQEQSWFEQCTNAIAERYRIMIGNDYTNDAYFNGYAPGEGYKPTPSQRYVLPGLTNFFSMFSHTNYTTSFPEPPWFFKKTMRLALQDEVERCTTYTRDYYYYGPNSFSISWQSTNLINYVLDDLVGSTNEIMFPTYFDLVSFAKLPSNFISFYHSETNPPFNYTSGFPMYTTSTTNLVTLTNSQTEAGYTFAAYIGYPQARWLIDSARVGYGEAIDGYQIRRSGDGTSTNSWSEAKSIAESSATTTNRGWIISPVLNCNSSGEYNGSQWTARFIGETVKYRCSWTNYTSGRQIHVLRPEPIEFSTYDDNGLSKTENEWFVDYDYTGSPLHESGTYGTLTPNWCDEPTFGNDTKRGFFMDRGHAVIDYTPSLNYKP